MVMRGAWRASTPSSPSAPVAMMNSTSPSNRLRSTLTTRSGYFMPSASFSLLHLFALLACLVDGADHVEGLLRQVVVLALEDLLEAAHGLVPGHVLALPAGEALGDAERLGQEALHLARARHRLLVVFRQLLHAEHRDD